MVSCKLTGTCTIALRSLVKRGDGASLPGFSFLRRLVTN
jgi:hypothetical protein